MNAIRKTRLSVALGVALGVSAIVPVTSYGFSVDLNANTIVTDGAGDSVLFPFYTTVNGAVTSYSLTNTSSDQTVAAKVRFREQVYSQDVLDFIVFLSPNDKFDFYVEAGANGRPVVVWNDNSCVTGVANVPNQTKRIAFPPSPGVADADMAVGHVEVIGMINLQGLQDRAGVDLDIAVKHNNDGIPLACNVALEAFRTRANVNLIAREGNPLFGNIGLLTRQDVGNVLVGAHVITIPGSGIEAGEDAIHIRNTFNRGFLAAQSAQLCNLANFNGINQGTSGCFSAYTWDTTEQDHPHLGDINWVGQDLLGGAPVPGQNTVARLDNLLAASVSLQGDWSNNQANNVGFDWVVTFPTKYVYMDRDCVPPTWEFVNVGNKLTGPLNKCLTPSPFGVVGDNACLIGAAGEDIVDVYNTEEGRDSLFSPADANVLDFCAETQVFTLVKAGEVGTEVPSLLQTPLKRGVVEFDQTNTLPGNRGWADVFLNWVDRAVVPTHVGNARDGAATAGLLFLLRATADPTQNNGSLRELNRNTGE